MSIMNKLKKNSKIEKTEILEESEFFTEEAISTTVPAINIALSGSIDGGLHSGLLTLAGPSKHFKSMFALLIAGAYLDAKPNAVMLFYDSEFGSPESYFKQFGIDTSRVLHTPVMNIEEMKFDIIAQLDALEKKDEVIIVVDSIGNLASKKEIEDARDESSKADMTRAKSLKGLFRMVTPYLRIKQIPMIAVNHTYKEQSLFPKDIVSGGTGIYLSSDAVWIMGRRQRKTATEVTGYDFIINIDKSRYIKEKTKIPVSVSWDGGVETYSGLLDIAVAGGFVTKPSKGWYQKSGSEKKVREKDTKYSEFWEPILEDEKFQEFVESMYKIGGHSPINPEDFLE